MKRLLNAGQMKAADQRTIARGLPSLVLMERAALCVLQTMIRRQMPLDRVLVLAGTGNNAGDGIAVARMLCERGYHPSVLLAGNPEKYSEQMKQQMEILRWYDVNYVDAYEAGRYGTVIDALFGVGLTREITGRYRELIDAVNADAIPRVLAVDIPSGIHADTGAVCGISVRAECTVTFAFGKPGLYLFPGTGYAGEVTIAQIGIPQRSIEAPEQEAYFLLEEADLRMIPPRVPDGNKGTFGKVLVIAGSDTICGAAYLAARACLMSGAGMVRILTEEANRVPLAASFPEALITTYRKEDSADILCTILRDALAWADGVLIGPGIGTGRPASVLLEAFLGICTKPAVLDADALNLLAEDPARLKQLRAGWVITPHMAEMSRLTGITVRELKADPFAAAEAFAKRYGVVCVLKDARTVIAYPDGSAFLAADGSSALATAGSGDVLSGITAALLTQMPESENRAAALAVLVHACCGKDAGIDGSEASVLASDILCYLKKYL